MLTIDPRRLVSSSQDANLFRLQYASRPESVPTQTGLLRVVLEGNLPGNGRFKPATRSEMVVIVHWGV